MSIAWEKAKAGAKWLGTVGLIVGAVAGAVVGGIIFGPVGILGGIIGGALTLGLKGVVIGGSIGGVIGVVTRSDAHDGGSKGVMQARTCNLQKENVFQPELNEPSRKFQQSVEQSRAQTKYLGI